MSGSRFISTITRETGMAMAVLAVWMLSLLAPLHQTSGLLREMEKAGYDISGAWSICVTLAQDEDGGDHAVPVCPAQAIGKSDVLLPPPPVMPAGFVPVARGMVFGSEQSQTHRPQNFTPGQPRAPPAQV